MNEIQHVMLGAGRRGISMEPKFMLHLVEIHQCTLVGKEFIILMQRTTGLLIIFLAVHSLIHLSPSPKPVISTVDNLYH